MYKNIFSFAVLFFLVLAPISKFVFSAEPQAEIVVEKFQSLLLSVMKTSKNTSVKQRFDILAPAVETSFHLPLMTRIVVGDYWKKIDQNQKLKLKSSFHRMSVSILATLFDDYNGERFSYEKTRPGPSGTKLVFTNLLKLDSEKISIIYVTHNFEGGWRIIDVVVDGGISELKVRKSEYRKILQTEGVSGLTASLNKAAERIIAGE